MPKRRVRITITLTDDPTMALLGSVSVETDVDEELVSGPPSPQRDRAQDFWQQTIAALGATAYLDAFGARR